MRHITTQQMIQRVWDRIEKPPWVTMKLTCGGGYGLTSHYQVHNEKRNRYQIVAFDERDMWRPGDRETDHYIMGQIYPALDDVNRNTIDSAVGSIDVYRGDD